MLESITTTARPDPRPDSWAAAEAYGPYMGRWSALVACPFIDWLALPRGARWLDVGCGTGAFSELILRRCAPRSIVGIDPSPQQIDYAQKKLPDVTFQVGDSMDMSFGDSEFDVVASALVFHFIPNRQKAFAEMYRVLKPGGLVGGYTWKRSATADFAPYTAVNRAAKQIGAETVSSATVPEGSEEGMRASLQAAGFRDIAITEIEVSQSFKNFDDYWEVQSLPFSPPGKTIAKLDDAQRARVQALLREMLPAAPDGSITYSATALAGKARKP